MKIRLVKKGRTLEQKEKVGEISDTLHLFMEFSHVAEAKEVLINFFPGTFQNLEHEKRKEVGCQISLC